MHIYICRVLQIFIFYFEDNADGSQAPHVAAAEAPEEILGQGGNLCRGHLLVPQTVCRWEVHDIHVILAG